MARKVDVPGTVSDRNVKTATESDAVGTFLVDFPLWKFGRVKLESNSPKASLAAFAVILLLATMVLLFAIDRLPGDHSVIGPIEDRLGQALTLAIGVLLGVDWKRNRK